LSNCRFTSLYFSQQNSSIHHASILNSFSSSSPPRAFILLSQCRRRIRTMKYNSIVPKTAAGWCSMVMSTM
jgi:hypothetical protein